MLFLLFGNLEQFLLSLLCMSKAEVICWFSLSGFYTLKSVFNSTAFQQSCQHHLTVPFFSFKKHPSCVCQEFDTSLAWVRKTYGCSISWNMGNAWEQCSSASCVTVVTPYWGFKAQHSYLAVPSMVWSPVACDTSLFFSTTVVTLPFCRRSSHYWAGHPTVRGPTVRQLAHSVYLVLLTFNQDLF